MARGEKAKKEKEKAKKGPAAAGGGATASSKEVPTEVKDSPDGDRSSRSVYSEQQALECEILLDEVSDAEDETVPNEIILNSSIEEEFGPPKYDPVAEQEAIDKYRSELKKTNNPTYRDNTESSAKEIKKNLSPIDRECVDVAAMELDPDRAGNGASSDICDADCKKEPSATDSGATVCNLSAENSSTTYSGNLSGNNADLSNKRVTMPSMTNNRAPPREYIAIRNHHATNNMCADLSGKYPKRPVLTGQFFVDGDTRENIAVVDLNMELKRATSYSFSPGTMECACCGKFLRRAGASGAGAEAGGNFPRQTFILTDQNFPAALPASGDPGGCLKIVRVDNGSLRAVVDEFIRVAKGWELLPGSQFLIGSISHLANVGTVAYIEDYVAARERLMDVCRGRMGVSHSPFVPLAGIEDSLLIRAIVELFAWLDSDGANQVGLPRDAIISALNDINSLGHGGLQLDYAIKYRLPVSVTDVHKKIWFSDNLSGLPNKVAPFGPDQEKAIIRNLIGFLNTTHALDLSQNPCHNRQVEKTESRAGQFHYVLVGGSHANRLYAELTNEGATVSRISTCGWKPTVPEVAELKAKIIRAEEATPPDAICCVVYNLFDNCFFFSRGDDGSLTRAARGADGVYHIVGESVLAPKELQQRTLKQLVPLLEAGGNCPKILISPLPRYLERGCCPDSGHVTNRTSADYKEELEKEIYSCKTNLKDFCFANGIRKCRIVSAWQTVKKIPGIWRTDPIHLSAAGYAAIATAVCEAADAISSKRKLSEQELSNASKKPRMEPGTSHERHGWVARAPPVRRDHDMYDGRGWSRGRPAYFSGGNRGGYWNGRGGRSGRGGRGGGGRDARGGGGGSGGRGYWGP